MKELLDLLEKLASEMDIPKFRRRDARWILRNARIRSTNLDHPKFKQLIKTAKEVIK